MRGLAADAGVDLVEDERLPSSDGREGERDAGELAARGGLGDGTERQPRIRADQEDGLVRAARARVALAQLDAELSLPQADASQLLGDGGRERRGGSPRYRYSNGARL